LNSSNDGVLNSFQENQRSAWLAAIVCGGLVHILLWPFSEPPWLFSDFFKAYWVAGEHLWNGGLEAGYPFTIRGNWSNLPVLAWPFALLVPLGKDAAGWVYLAVGALATVAAWAVLARVAGLRGGLAAALLFFFLLNGPLLNSLREGNSTHFVLLYLVLGLALWQAKRGFAAGLLFGLGATIKLPLLLLGVFFAVRRQWDIVAGGATTVAVAGLLSLATFGYEAHLLWFDEAVGSNIGAVMPAFNVQSVDGFLMRLSTGATELLYWGPIEPSLSQKITRNLILALLLGGFGWLILRTERRGFSSSSGQAPTRHDLLQFSIVLILSLVISPLSWTHYYLFVLLPLGLYLGGKLPLPDDQMTRWLFWLGYALTSLPVIMPAMKLDPDPPPGWLAELAARTIVSAWVFGGVLMIACFARGLWIATRTKSDEGSEDAQIGQASRA
jgi:hypothetical protein